MYKYTDFIFCLALSIGSFYLGIFYFKSGYFFKIGFIFNGVLLLIGSIRVLMGNQAHLFPRKDNINNYGNLEYKKELFIIGNYLFYNICLMIIAYMFIENTLALLTNVSIYHSKIIFFIVDTYEIFVILSPIIIFLLFLFVLYKKEEKRNSKNILYACQILTLISILYFLFSIYGLYTDINNL